MPFFDLLFASQQYSKHRASALAFLNSIFFTLIYNQAPKLKITSVITFVFVYDSTVRRRPRICSGPTSWQADVMKICKAAAIPFPPNYSLRITGLTSL